MKKKNYQRALCPAALSVCGLDLYVKELEKQTAPVLQDESQLRWASSEVTANMFAFVVLLKSISKL